MQCPYCHHAVTTRIPAIPEQVCDTHAAEFWTGLLAFAVTRPDVHAHLTTALPSGVSDLNASTPPAAVLTVVRPAAWNAERAEAVAAA